MSQAAADDRYAGWRDSVSRVLTGRGDGNRSDAT
jgi:hypothetical protein